MTVYRLRSDHEQFMTFTIAPKELRAKMGDNFTYHFDRTPTPQTPHWSTPNGRFYQPVDFPKANKIPDITDWTISDLVFNQKTYQIFSETLKDYGEFLTISVEGIPYYLFNVLKVIDQDAIDESQSEQKLKDGQYEGLVKLKFREDKIKDLLLFRTSYDEYLNIYCQDDFKNMVEKSALSGLIFKTDLAGVL